MSVRLRPVLMSTFTTVVAMLPLLLFPSEASSIYRGIPAVIVGGVIANLVSVFVITAVAFKQFGPTTFDLSKTSDFSDLNYEFGGTEK
jgi:multidrug efflux pump subunit AcrB